MSVDLLVRNAAWRGNATDIAVSDGVFVAIGEGLEERAATTIDASGLTLFPGAIDPHVHFNEPGRTDWEGFYSGSRAFAAGGGTLFFDMPLNANPPTTTREAFRLKLAAAEASSITDFALWGGITPDNLHELPALAECGVIGFKAFLSPSGIEEFSHVTPDQLEAAMQQIAPFGLVAGVHAEDPDLLRIGRGEKPWQRFADSRPPEAEISAVRTVIDLAAATSCPAHIVHVSLPESLRMISSARANGVDITAEACAHHLLLDESEMDRQGALAKCAPPLRSRATADGLWECLSSIHMIGSDHSPSPPHMKMQVPFDKAWGGISGVQHTLPLMIRAFAERGLSTDTLAELASRQAAKRFKLPPGKGEIRLGADADFCLIDCSRERSILKESLLDRHQHSPYVGRHCAVVTHTVRRGELILGNGAIATSATHGKCIRPSRN